MLRRAPRPPLARGSESRSLAAAAVNPLAGIKVIDLTRILAGPYCTQALADAGADVVKIEEPGKGDDTRGWGPPFVGRRERVFPLREPRQAQPHPRPQAGRGPAHPPRAARHAPTWWSENFRPGTLERLGFGYDVVRGRNPRIVYASISGYGADGPWGGAPGLRRGHPGRGRPHEHHRARGRAAAPRRAPRMADVAAGMTAYQGILLALLRRARTGEGGRVDVSLLESLLPPLAYHASTYLLTGKVPRPSRQSPSHPGAVRDLRGRGRLRDRGRRQRVAVAVVLRRRGRAGAGRRRALRDQRAAGGELRRAARRCSRRAVRSRGRWRSGSRRSRRRAIPCGRVRTVAEALDDPQVAARGLIVEREHAPGGRGPLRGQPHPPRRRRSAAPRCPRRSSASTPTRC